MRTSVVIANLNSRLIDQTLAALRRQGAPGEEAEVLVVGRDDLGLVRQAPGVHFLETTLDLNPAAARNLGVAQARGEALLFTDADCRPAPDWIERLMKALERSPVAGGAVAFDRRANRWALADNIASFHELLPDRPADPHTRRPLGSLNLGLRRGIWDEVGAFDESLPTSEDFDWVLRARARGLATGFSPHAVVEHLPVRRNRAELEAHAAWYGRHFNSFRRKHPGLLDRGPTWRTRRRLAQTAPLKALTSALAIFVRHPSLWPCLRAYPGVVLFKRAWYRAVTESWP